MRTDEKTKDPRFGRESIKTFIDVAISFCVAVAILTPAMAEAQGKGFCAKEDTCSLSCRVAEDPKRPGVTSKCNVQQQQPAEIYSLCNSCDDTPCPYKPSCKCKVQGNTTQFYCVPKAC